MKKVLHLLMLLLIFSLQNIKAQNSVVGSYHISSANPDDGGYNRFLFENHEFAMLTFGQIIADNYTVYSENEINSLPFIFKKLFYNHRTFIFHNSGNDFGFRVKL